MGLLAILWQFCFYLKKSPPCVPQWLCLHSQQQCGSVPVSPHLCSHLLLSILDLSHSDRVEVVLHCGFDLRFPTVAVVFPSLRTARSLANRITELVVLKPIGLTLTPTSSDFGCTLFCIINVSLFPPPCVCTLRLKTFKSSLEIRRSR